MSGGLRLGALPAFEHRFDHNGRYTLEHLVGTGAFGVVYAATDRELNRRVALKVLRSEDPGALFRFKREFRELARIQHPNLVRLYELESFRDFWFFTMELIDGVDFVTYARGADWRPPPSEWCRWSEDVTAAATMTVEVGTALASGTAWKASGTQVVSHVPLDTTRCRSALSQLTAGLECLHLEGRLHCDIKPKNVLVTDEGRVVILDFGLVRSRDAAPAAPRRSVAEIAGTPAYMSPEQSLGATLGPEADWYAVGAMLYAAITGNPPFAAEGADFVAAKRVVEPPAAVDLVANADPALSSLAASLLRREPERRAGSHAIRSCLALRQRHPSLPVARSFVGRTEEISRLYGAASMRGAKAIFLRGASGIGKTHLVDRFVNVELPAHGRPFVAFRGRCYESESVPYKALDGLVDHVVEHLFGRGLDLSEHLDPYSIAILVRFFPVVRRLTNVPVDSVTGESARKLRTRAAAGLARLFSLSAESYETLVVIVDDLHWGDADSVPLLGMLMSELRSRDVIWLFAMRPDSSCEAGLHGVLSGTEVRVDTVDLSPLSSPDAQELARLSAVSLDDAQVRSVAAAAEGNPFLLGEFARTLASEARGQALSPGDFVRRRMKTLSHSAGQLLEVVAVAGHPMPVDVVLASAAMAENGASILEELRRECFVSLSGLRRHDLVEIRHDRIRETLIAAIEPARRAAIHGSIARAGESAGRVDAESLAYHHSRSKDPKRASAFAEQAGDHAQHALAFDRAAGLYRLAFDTCSNTGDRHGLQIKLAQALSQAGRGREAAAEFLAAADDARGDAAIDLRRRGAEELLTSGNVDAGLAHVHRVLEALGTARVPRTPALALASLLAYRARLRVRGYGSTPVSEDALSRSTRIRIDTSHSLARGLGFIDGIRGARFQTENLLAALDAGEPKRILRALSAEVAYAASEGPGQWSRVEELLNLARGLARHIEDHDVLGLATVTEGMAHYFVGNLPQGRARIQEAEAYLERYGAGAFEVNSARYMNALILKWMGHPAEMAKVVPAYIDDALRRGDQFSEVQLRMEASHFLALSQDDPTGAKTQIRRGVQNWSQSGFYLQHYWEVARSAEVHLYLGQADEAVRAVERRWKELQRSLLLRVFVVELDFRSIRGRAHLMAATADLAGRDRCLRSVERDAKALGKSRIPIAVGLSSMLRAGVALCRGEGESAERWLEIAEDGFARGHMDLHRQAVRARKGMLQGSIEQRDAAYEAMGRLGVADPGRMTDSLLPWPKKR